MAFPDQFSVVVHSKPFLLRRIVPQDRPYIEIGFRQLSHRSRYLRFFSLQPNLSQKQLDYLSNPDGVNHSAWCIIDESGSLPQPAGIGRLVRLKEEPSVAEVAITIADNYQRMGLGMKMLVLLNLDAVNMGIDTLRYHVLLENRFVADVLKNIGPVKMSREGEVSTIDCAVISGSRLIPDRPENKKILHTMKEFELLLP